MEATGLSSPLAAAFAVPPVASKELQAIIQAREQARAAGRPAALVTVFQTAGSTYRRAGARMLVLPTSAETVSDPLGADLLGSISGGCLEDDARERARETLATGHAVCVVYDTTPEADILFGSGIGCQGVVHALIQPLPLDQPTADPLAYLDRALRERRAGAMATVPARWAAPMPRSPVNSYGWMNAVPRPGRSRSRRSSLPSPPTPA